MNHQKTQAFQIVKLIGGAKFGTLPIHRDVVWKYLPVLYPSKIRALAQGIFLGLEAIRGEEDVNRWLKKYNGEMPRPAFFVVLCTVDHWRVRFNKGTLYDSSGQPYEVSMDMSPAPKRKIKHA